MRTKPDPYNWKLKFPNKSHRENYLKTIEFKEPQWIPCSISIFDIVKIKYRKKLYKLVQKYPFIFGPFYKYSIKHARIPARYRLNAEYYDNWKCKWKVIQEGHEGQVVEHPLANWDAFENYDFPDPIKFTENGKRGRFFWALAKIGYVLARKQNILIVGGAERLFDRLYFLRGFNNLMIDIAREDPRLIKLIKKLTLHELKLVYKWIQTGVDVISFHTDIGTQNRLMIHPKQFRNLLEIVDDLIECGVSVHDPQLRANTLQGIAKYYKGKICIDLDLDRQSFPFATPEKIDKQIKDAVDTLNLPEGGLMLKAEISDPNIPFENIKAICEAYMKYCVL